ncbi:hypothetical protein [Neorhizobium galegae]|uniref:hypothetical protein n=1 Tax=Neorhizobium galegae TaxID=399 RepID=UPI003AF171B6
MFILLGFVKVLNAMKVDFRTATHARAFEDTLRFSLVGNNRAETSHLLLRKRERTMQGGRSAGGLRRSISIFLVHRNLFVMPLHRRSSLATDIHRIRAMAHCKVVTGALPDLRQQRHSSITAR